MFPLNRVRTHDCDRRITRSSVGRSLYQEYSGGGNIQDKKVITYLIGTAEKFLDRYRRVRSGQVLGAASDVNTSVLIQRDCIHSAHMQAYRPDRCRALLVQLSQRAAARVCSRNVSKP